MKRFVPVLLALMAFALGGAATAEAQIPTRACTFGRDNAVPAGSTWADQFRCYQSSGRHITVDGTNFAEGVMSGGACVRGVGADRVQIGSCGGGFSANAAITISFAAIRSVVDDPDRPDAIVHIDR